MYEVGLALACRPPSDVLLIRDDHSPFLFDVSTIPHITMNFDNVQEARTILRSALIDRIREGDLIMDARVELAVSQLTDDEFRLLQIFGGLQPNQGVDIRLSIGDTKVLSESDARGIDGLLRKRLIKVFGAARDGGLLYRTTEFGYAIARVAEKRIKVFDTVESQNPDA